MLAGFDQAADEVKVLRRCMNDLMGLFALPAVWSGAGPDQITRTLVDALAGMLQLDLVYVRLNSTEDHDTVEMLKTGPRTTLTDPRDAGAALEGALGEDPGTWPARLRCRLAGTPLSIVTMRLGALSDLGLLVAASERPTFAEDTELLLLSVAANQAVVALQGTRLLGEQTRLARSLDQRVGQRTRELAEVNAALNDEIVERRRTEEALGREKQLLEMIASGRSLRDVLGALCRFVEGTTPDCHCGVYPIDWAGPTFQYGVAPSLPASYTDPIEGLPVRCDVAPCGIAAYENIQVIAADIDSDPRWRATPYRSHVLQHGLRAVWSTPICSREGRVLGTFCIYRRMPARPSAHHQALIAHATHIASIAIERSQADTALIRSQALLAEGQRLSLTGTFAWNVDEDDITFSEELRRIFELDADEAVTLEQIATRVHPEDVGVLSEKIGRARAGGDDLEYEVRLLMPEGRIKYVHAIAHRVPHGDSEVEFLGAVMDITDRRLSEQALDRVRSELAHVTRTMSLGVLTASIAHEVNQPLSGIITNASTCLRMLAATPPNIEGALETARRTIRDGNRASEVVARLRALFRKKEVVMEPVDLNEATREVIALSGQDLHRRRISLQTELDAELPPVSGDRVQLQQVILNLLLNASDAVRTVDDRPKQIVIRTTRGADGAARLTVRDSGEGVVPDALDKLFDAFYTTKADGMGIGLSVSRSIIESHHGRLWCEPHGGDGPGATFTFSIPFSDTTLLAAVRAALRQP